MDCFVSHGILLFVFFFPCWLLKVRLVEERMREIGSPMIVSTWKSHWIDSCNSYLATIEMNQKLLCTHKNWLWKPNNRSNKYTMKQQQQKYAKRWIKQERSCVRMCVFVWNECEYFIFIFYFSFWVCDHSTHNYIQWRPLTITTAYTR